MLFFLTGCDPMPHEAEIGVFEEDEELALGSERFWLSYDLFIQK